MIIYILKMIQKFIEKLYTITKIMKIFCVKNNLQFIKISKPRSGGWEEFYLVKK